jgi:hypothetical protein
VFTDPAVVSACLLNSQENSFVRARCAQRSRVWFLVSLLESSAAAIWQIGAGRGTAPVVIGLLVSVIRDLLAVFFILWMASSLAWSQAASTIDNFGWVPLCNTHELIYATLHWLIQIFGCDYRPGRNAFFEKFRLDRHRHPLKFTLESCSQ